MAKHFADTFDISPVTDAVCCKCMAQCVKVRLLYICFIQIRIKLVLISTGFHRGKFIQHINPIILIREKKWKEKFRNRDLADRAERFGRSFIQNRFLILLPDLNSLDSPVNMNCFSLEVDIFPFLRHRLPRVSVHIQAYQNAKLTGIKIREQIAA